MGKSDKTSKKIIKSYKKEISLLENQLTEKEETISKLKMLIDVNSVITSSLDKKRVLRTILDQTKKLIGCLKSSILLVDKETNQLIFEVLTNEEDEKFLSDIRLNIGEGIAGMVWEHGQPILVEDAQKDARFSEKADKKSDFITTSIIAVPLIANGKIIGVMEAINKVDGSFFHHLDLELFQNISVQAAVAIQNASLYDMAISDGKTQLFIHRYFQVRLDEELKRVVRYGGFLSLVMFDLDHFKSINDTYGHQFGDEVLIKVANVIKKNCRTSDVPSRFGGEEFAIMLTETNKEGAKIFGEKIRKVIEELEIEYNGKKIKVTISGGITSFPDDNPKDIQEFIEMADKSLYVSKKEGRNKITGYSPEMANEELEK
ncbi:MAG: hypothetical protein A2086_04850 [Spirochaetes bacterium GWD1_27_9]|nr:MAG: hypothetical protein A2Z98_04265 [Spirochaetes bacterium GWB1_27_13]OHD27634.1 MAG: hypothetical protein A2Y34_00305 [Spirochaetes bacterium GWC1_27_15]OHD31944.1 MAG: hypothetical protein A2086_04850 [Spirochaetes bacterium GWD1_27_9]